jgi:hypothetical protein
VKNVAQPEVLEELLARLARLEPETKARWGTMTAGEMVCHLADVGDMATGKRNVAVPDTHGWQSKVAKFLILNTALPFPKGVPTRAGLDPRREGTKPADFARDRARAAEGLRALAAIPGDRPGPVHGRFGPMTMADWHRQGYRHTDHHLKQFGL